MLLIELKDEDDACDVTININEISSFRRLQSGHGSEIRLKNGEIIKTSSDYRDVKQRVNDALGINSDY
jgi:hypothetical protein